MTVKATSYININYTWSFRIYCLLSEIFWRRSSLILDRILHSRSYLRQNLHKALLDSNYFRLLSLCTWQISNIMEISCSWRHSWLSMWSNSNFSAKFFNIWVERYRFHKFLLADKMGTCKFCLFFSSLEEQNPSLKKNTVDKEFYDFLEVFQVLLVLLESLFLVLHVS